MCVRVFYGHLGVRESERVVAIVRTCPSFVIHLASLAEDSARALANSRMLL